MNQPTRPVCSFLIPILRDSDGRPHQPILWRLLQDEMVRLFGGLSGPEPIYYRRAHTVPGSWSPGPTSEPVEDESRRYTVAVTPDQLDELRALIRRAGNSFDQRVMYLEVAGFAELLEPDSDRGLLD